MHTINIYTATITLILVMDPLGNIPLFLSILNKVPPQRQSIILLRECFVAFIILTAFLFFGHYILKGLNISEPALGIGGGIVLFIIALRMIFPHPEAQVHDPIIGEPFIVPMAVPLIAGPATLATVLLFTSQQPGMVYSFFLALVIASVILTIILLCSSFLMKILGKRCLIAIERLMGLILTTVAVQMFLTGIAAYFKL